jgi:DNA polymerase-3 subunit chi
VDEDDELAPVLIVAPEFQAPMRPLVLNLRAEAVPSGFERVLEVVPADASAREPLRLRWKEYAARGIEVAKHDM